MNEGWIIYDKEDANYHELRGLVFACPKCDWMPDKYFFSAVIKRQVKQFCCLNCDRIYPIDKFIFYEVNF